MIWNEILEKSSRKVDIAEKGKKPRQGLTSFLASKLKFASLFRKVTRLFNPLIIASLN